MRKMKNSYKTLAKKNRKDKDYVINLGVYGTIWKEYCVKVWTAVIWLRTGTSGGLLYVR
jgi:hypothetical protein